MYDLTERVKRPRSYIPERSKECSSLGGLAHALFVRKADRMLTFVRSDISGSNGPCLYTGTVTLVWGVGN